MFRLNRIKIVLGLPLHVPSLTQDSVYTQFPLMAQHYNNVTFNLGCTHNVYTMISTLSKTNGPSQSDGDLAYLA